MTRTLTLLTVFLLGAARLFALDSSLPFLHSDRIRYDANGLQIEGRDTFIYSGAFHYFRVPKELWRDRFEKMKAAGFNGVETYTPWNFHERNSPSATNDFSKVTGLKDLDDWISLAEELGFYVIIRPGPYICAEWDGGGFPQWLVTQKKPTDWPADKSWLQTDDPEYLAWVKHWYDAVCPVIAKHQITRKAPGQPGVILFQIENEYNRVNWLPKAVKRRQLEFLAEAARANGIDVPTFTCWTSEPRGVTNGPLRGVFDMMNYYPKWEVAKELSKRTANERPQQPLAPAMSAELQGGWYSEVGGKLSSELDYTAPVQTQNITLYALQLGYSLINFYMLVGGSNFDDWASRETTQTYDFNAAIHEDGSLGEKYQRLAAIGQMLREHGPRMMHAQTVLPALTNSNPAVQIAIRQAPDGSRYIFVRTENRTSAQKGSVKIQVETNAQPLAFDYELEPFGSKILYLAPGVADAKLGEWLPKQLPVTKTSAELPGAITINQVESVADPLPQQWTSLPPGDSLENHGVMDRHFIYYRVRPAPDKTFSVSRLGARVVKDTKADGVVAVASGRRLPEQSSDTNAVTFLMPRDATEVLLLHENRGLQHHSTPVLERNWRNGIRAAMSGTNQLALEFATGERERGIAFSSHDQASNLNWHTHAVGQSTPGADALLSWHRMSFELPAITQGVAWHLRLRADGNGFIYLNGHCLGRFWEAGPQTDFYLPEPWLNHGAGKTNRLVISLLPAQTNAVVWSASIISAPTSRN